MSTYTEIMEADAFFAGRTDAVHWQNFSDEIKQNTLERASRMLDEAFDWKGRPLSETQPLRWPRKDVTDLDGTPIDPETIPLRIRIAAMEQALYLTDPLKKMAESGIKNASAGEMSLAFSARENSMISPLAIAAVRGLGELRSRGNPSMKCGSVLRG